ncbi:DUF6503 family protein [Persicitalea jodogahamensis]|uniref:Deoxyribose-phosphate aldolase n=1 Tax=Persicitalea jodogahamensis TaxID=402147 RepID=A0A8J3DB62_9BACT|nr:DUF6503 family protein [Persicitalea jodogahamensis]GHB84783.1 hypothetical protein GCM10007390_44970 [Persicitalea jodogahamensis]
MRISLLLLFFTSLAIFSCQKEDKAQTIVEKAIAYHGGSAYDQVDLEFDFRDKHYIVQKNGGDFRYERIQTDSTGAEIRDILTNAEAYRTIDGQRQTVPDTTMDKYKYSVNSVAYFLLLPAPLRDPAVQKEYVGEVTIKGKTYDKVKVFFNEEGGGKDHDDVFVYYFDKENGSMDYLSYLYYTDETGMRFREAYNPQRVGGLLVQDYINFAPTDSTLAVTDENLLSLDRLYEEGQLKELSRIENKNFKTGKN